MNWRKVKKIILFYYLILALAFGYSACLIYNLAGPHYLSVYFLDIGQGDSILIRTPNFQNIVIDGGPDNTLIYKLGRYLPYFDRTIDLMVLSHPDSDHLIGLVEMLKRYQIKAILFTNAYDKSPTYDEFKKLALKNNCRLLLAGEISKINISEKLNLEIMYPQQNVAGVKIKDNNDLSLVFKFNYKDISILFTGDAPKKIEDILISEGANLASTVLKVSHHGSNISTSDNFLDAVRPQLAIISVGQNHFNHPTPEVIGRLANHKIITLITLKLGDIEIRSDGHGISTFSP